MVTKVDSFQSLTQELAGSKHVLIKFEAEWCMPCKAMSSVVEAVASQYPELKVIAADIEGEGMEEALLQYKVMSVPTFIYLNNGATVNTACGTISKAELSRFIEGV